MWIYIESWIGEDKNAPHTKIWIHYVLGKAIRSIYIPFDPSKIVHSVTVIVTGAVTKC